MQWLMSLLPLVHVVSLRVSVFLSRSCLELIQGLDLSQMIWLLGAQKCHFYFKNFIGIPVGTEVALSSFMATERVLASLLCSLRTI